MKIDVIYEISVLAEADKNSQTGIYRVAFELLTDLYQCSGIQLYAAISGHKHSRCTTKEVREFLHNKSLTIPLANDRERVKFIPFRKEKLFKFIYKKIGVSDYKQIYNKTILKNATLYHSIYYEIPYEIKKYPHIKRVLTIHDLIPILYPMYNANTEQLKDAINSNAKDGYFICVSENTKKDLLKFNPEIDPKRIYVSLLAASKKYFYQNKNKDDFDKIQDQYQLPKKYFLSLSTLEPRKNIDHVIRSFYKFIRKNKIDDISLVLVGSKGWDYDKIFQEHETSQELKNKIIFTGRVPDEDLASIYSNAYSFFYLSIYEGFGLPPLEAMQCGIPVVTSNTSSLPEVVGDAGILLDPKDENGLIETMQNLYTNETLRQELSNKSIDRAKEFSWKKTSEKHLEIYNAIINS